MAPAILRSFPEAPAECDAGGKKMEYWESLATIYESAKGISRPTPTSHRLMTLAPLELSDPQADHWQEAFFPIIKDPEYNMAELVGIDQVPEPHLFRRWAQGQDATIERTWGRTDLTDTEWKAIKQDLLGKAILGSKNYGFVNTYAFWHPLGDLDKVAGKMIPHHKAIPRRLAIRFLRCALSTDAMGAKTEYTAFQVLKLEGDQDKWFWRANKPMSWYKYNSNPDYLRSKEEEKEDRKNAKGAAKGKSKGDHGLRQQEDSDPWQGYKAAPRSSRWNDWADWST